MKTLFSSTLQSRSPFYRASAPVPSPTGAERRDAQRCRKIVCTARRRAQRAAQHKRAAQWLHELPGVSTFGNFLYQIGFWVEYQMLCATRVLARYALFAARIAQNLLQAILQPVVLDFSNLWQELTHLTLRKALCGLLPLAAAGLLIATVQRGLSHRYVLQVTVDGETLGCVANEQVFDAAQEDVNARILSARRVLQDAGQLLPAGQWAVWPTYTLTVSNQTITEPELVNALLRATGSTLGEATSVYLDGSLRFVTADGDHLRHYLQSLRQPYLDTNDPNRRVEFLHGLRLVDGLFLQDSIQPYDQVLTALQGGEGWLQIKVIVRQTTTLDIPYATETTTSDDYDFGARVTVQQGQLGLQEVTQDLAYVGDALVDATVLSVVTVREPVTEQIVEGSGGMVASLGDGAFVWPVPGYRSVTRWMSDSHNGADIAADYGTPILASASGTVTIATYHNNPFSYGNYVVIDHGNGYRTLYGHMSAFAVQQGDIVEQGQIIGYVGSTGYSFGNHCHFEMYGPDGRFSAQALFPHMRTG